MSNALLEARALGQSTWYDNIRRGLLTSGELSELIQLGVTGVTSNPTIFEKAIIGSSDYDQALSELARARLDPVAIFEALAIEDIQSAADLLRSVYDHTNGDDGYASLEVSPHLAHDTHGTIAAGRQLFAALNRPNVLIKVPATPEGIPAVRTLIADGINVNVTLIFSLAIYRQVMDAYIRGLEELVAQGKDPGSVTSVASFFVSRVDTAVDKLLQDRIDGGQAGLEPLLGEAAVANARKAYALFREEFGTERFAALKAKGARVQRPLWASTSTKNPTYPDTLYVDTLIGPDTVNTMPPTTVEATLDHGNPRRYTLEGTLPDAETTWSSLADAGIDMEAVSAKLLTDGVDSFAGSYDEVLASITAKCSKIMAGHAV
jgi:transaldolase